MLDIVLALCKISDYLVKTFITKKFFCEKKGSYWENRTFSAKCPNKFFSYFEVLNILEFAELLWYSSSLSKVLGDLITIYCSNNQSLHHVNACFNLIKKLFIHKNMNGCFRFQHGKMHICCWYRRLNLNPKFICMLR